MVNKRVAEVAALKEGVAESKGMEQQASSHKAALQVELSVLEVQKQQMLASALPRPSCMHASDNHVRRDQRGTGTQRQELHRGGQGHPVLCRATGPGV